MPTAARPKKKAITKKPAKKVVKSPAQKSSSSIRVARLKVGDKAPAFSLLNQDGKPISLVACKGKSIVLYFYPRAMTPGCTIQACGIRDHGAEFKRRNTIVLGVSPDKVSALAKFRKRDKLNFDLLSDENATLAKRYGVWGLKKFMGREFMGVRRWTFVIGKNGKIKYILDKVDTKTHHDDVLALLDTMK